MAGAIAVVLVLMGCFLAYRGRVDLGIMCGVLALILGLIIVLT